MKNRIDARFAALREAGRKALIPYIVAGDPSADLTVDLMHGLARAGSDVIELGVPFSDPSADGPVNQRAADRAIANGVGLGETIACVRAFRRDDATTPVVLMGYANSFEHRAAALGGLSALALDLATAGVDGVLVVDYPPEESASLDAALKQAGLCGIYLLAPTSSDARIERIGRAATGYLYYVALKGITGASTLDVASVAERVPAIRRHTRVPIGVGFGIRDAASAAAVARIADAVVIGSRLVETIEGSPASRVVADVCTFIATIRTAIDATEGSERTTIEEVA